MFWTIRESAGFLKMKFSQVYYLITEGKLAAIKFGDVWRIAHGDVENYAKGLPLSNDCQKIIIENLPAILTVPDIADYFNVERRTVYNLITGFKDIPAWKAEKGWCIARSDLLEYCSKNFNLS
jgi:excisionase family DNA binding protein